MLAPGLPFEEAAVMLGLQGHARSLRIKLLAMAGDR